MKTIDCRFKMTRWVRAGNTQKHKKMPGDATKWGEFDSQNINKNSSGPQNVKNEPNSDQNKKPFIATDFLTKKNTYSNKRCEKLGKYKKRKMSLDIKDGKNSKSDDINNDYGKMYTNKLSSSLISDVQVCTTQEEVKSQKKLSVKQKVSFKKLKNKQKTKQQNDANNSSNLDVNDKSSDVSTTKTFEKKKFMYLEKLKKKRAEKGIILLPSKIERKLYNIRRKLKEKGLSPGIIKDILRKERRKEELKFRKTVNPSKLCFNCRQSGHVLADCPVKLGSSNQETGICFKCGSVEHTSFKCPEKVQGFPFAKCFICKEQGHISRDCPKNKHGVYPKGGRCNLCGNVNHLKKDCPSLKKEKDELTVTLHTINKETSIDAEVSEKRHIKKENAKKPKIVKF